MSLVHRPKREDYFPATRRGHGSAPDNDIRHPKQPRCVDVTCQLNAPKSGNQHIDQEANMRDWCGEHGLSLRTKDRPHGRYRHPQDAMDAATGGK